MLLLYFVIAGILIGLALGGRLGALSASRIRLWPVALAGLAFQVLLFSPPLATVVGDLGPALYVASSGAVLLALAANARQPGFALIALGASLNLLAIIANGGQMPSSPDAWAQLSGVARVPVEHFSNSALAGAETHFPYLGDIFVLPRPIPMANVFSIGDVLIGLGGAWFIVRTMRGHALAGSEREVKVPAAGEPAAG